jgi:hypothetical protein
MGHQNSDNSESSKQVFHGFSSRRQPVSAIRVLG